MFQWRKNNTSINRTSKRATTILQQSGLLTEEEIELIAAASNEDKFIAMEYVIINENNYKQRKEIFYRNTASIYRVKRKMKF